jgi:hypothetical protein
MAAKFDMEALTRNSELVALRVSAEDVFSLLNRAFSVPTSWVALAWGKAGRPWVAPSGSAIEASDVRDILLVRTTSFLLEYSFTGLASRDGYEFSASARLPVQTVANEADLSAFERTLLGSSERVEATRLRQHCEEAVQTAVAEFASERSAETLSSAASWDAFDAVLVERFKPVGFASGLALGTELRVTFESPAYVESRQAEQTSMLRRQRQEADERLRAVAAAARTKHLAELGTLLEQVKGIADKSGGLNVADLMKTFDAQQRGALYEGLVTLSQLMRRTEAILVLAGTEILWLDPADPHVPLRRQDLAGDAGPLRSIRLAGDDDEQRLLVGARRGVHVLDTETGERKTYILPAEYQPRGGVNSTVIAGEYLYGTHSEIGLVRWPLEQPEESGLYLDEVTRGAKSIRDVQADETGRLWFSVNNLVVGCHPERDSAPTVMSAPAEVSKMVLADGFVHAGLTNGGIVRWSTANPGMMETLRGEGRDAVRSIAWLRGGGIPRLLIADGEAHLDLQVLGDAYHGEYRCERRLRWGFAADDYIVGVDSTRDRLFLWRIDAPAQPVATVSAGRICGRSIHDVAMLPEQTETQQHNGST